MLVRPNDVLKAEILALWYFRLNGVFTIPNFVLHPATRGPARTDADIAGVRFPHRREFPAGVGGDDDWFQARDAKPTAVVAEVKTGECALNGPWSDPDRANVNKIFSDLGLYSVAEIPAASLAVYATGSYDGAQVACSLFCVGNSTSAALTERYPMVPQKTWEHIAGWVFRRFDRYEDPKNDHDQWDAFGKAIWNHYRASRNAREFEQHLRRRFALPLGR